MTGVQTCALPIFFCLFLSTLFWLISAFSRTTTCTISVPVNFINFPQDKILKEELPTTLSLEIKANGFKLFFLSIKNLKEKINIDFKTLKKTSENIYSFSSTTQVSINRNLNAGIEVLHIKPDFIFVKENKSSIKRVKVVPDVMFDFETSGDLFTDIKSNPEYVYVSGDSSLLNSIDSIVTEKIILSTLDQTIVQRAELILPDESSEKIFISVNNVEISISKDKYTEAELDIPIQVKNLPQGFSIQLFPKKINIKFQVGIKNYSLLEDSLFNAFIDFDKLMPGKNFISVQVDKKPDFIKNVRLFPEKTEFLLKK